MPKSRNVHPRGILAVPALVSATFALGACSAGASACINTRQSVVLAGVITDRQVYGPPGFGETPEIDERRSIPILTLETPIDICQGSESEIDVTPLQGITEVQIVNYSSPYPSGRTLIAGSLERAQNAFHYTSIFLVVDEMRRPTR
jgi:hypothetical protein